MHSEYIENTIAAFDHEAELRNDMHVVATNWFVNRCPLASRLPRVPIGSTTFRTRNRGKADYQFCQTFRHPVNGRFRRPKIESPEAVIPWPKQRTESRTPDAPFDQAKMEGLQNLMDDLEMTCYYGQGEDPSTCGRPKQKGLRSILTTNRTLSPINADAYSAVDFIADTLERCRRNGGDPDVLLLSTNFMQGPGMMWGYGVQRLDAGANIFGTPIDIYEAPFLGGVTIIEAPLLRPFTAVCLTSSEVRLRMKRNEFWSQRGDGGEWIAEGAIEVENESHHAWLEGVTAFTAIPRGRDGA